ncbi:MAG: DUF4345 domain-containing protein [Planctomycetota bacterium]|jgi:hypothetical protein
MQPTKLHRTYLILAGLAATWIGFALVSDPHAFHATNGIELSSAANAMSEVRAPGAALLAFGAVLYLGYGFGRVVSVALDGNPGEGLLGAMAIEFVLGALALLCLRPKRYVDTSLEPVLAA